MSYKSTATLSTPVIASVDVFSAVAQIYLSSAERMVALNLATLRDAIEESCSTAKKTLPETESAIGLKRRRSASAHPLHERAMAYSRSAIEILVDAQKEVIEAVSARFSGSGADAKLARDWKMPFELMTKGVQQFSNALAQEASVVADAGAMAETAPQRKRVA